MQNRLKHLESLVKGVMTEQSPGGLNDTSQAANGSSQVAVDSQHQNLDEVGASFETAFDPSHANAAPSNSSGQVVLGPNESTYVGATHWAAILDDVSLHVTLLDLSTN
jgi:hypothetical protein